MLNAKKLFIRFSCLAVLCTALTGGWISDTHESQSFLAMPKAEAASLDRMFKDEFQYRRDQMKSDLVWLAGDAVYNQVYDFMYRSSRLMDKNSWEYQEHVTKTILNTMPFGKIRFLMQSTMGTQRTPGVIYLEPNILYAMENAIGNYSNVAITNPCFKGKNGPWIGFDVVKSEDPNDLVVTEQY